MRRLARAIAAAPARRRHGSDARGHRRHAHRRVPPLRHDQGLRVLFDLPSVRFFWVEEIGELCLAWMSFIGAAIGIRKGIHFSVQMITDRLPARAAPGRVHRALPAHRRLRRPGRRVRLAGGGAEQPVVLSRARPEPALALPVLGGGRGAHRDLQPRVDRGRLARALARASRPGRATEPCSSARSGCPSSSSPRCRMPIVFALGLVGLRRAPDRQLLAPEAAVEPGGGHPALGAPGHPDLRVRRQSHGALRDVVRARQPGPRARGLGAGRARHVGGAGRVLLLGHLGLDHRGRVGHRLHADAAHAARRLQARARRLAGGLGLRHGHPGAARHLHDRARPDHRHLRGRDLPRRLHPRGGERRSA